MKLTDQEAWEEARPIDRTRGPLPQRRREDKLENTGEKHTKVLLIDPPSGWRYGFPKPYINSEGKPLEEWLLNNGYPQHEIDNSGAKYCRFISWAERKEDEDS